MWSVTTKGPETLGTIEAEVELDYEAKREEYIESVVEQRKNEDIYSERNTDR